MIKIKVGLLTFLICLSFFFRLFNLSEVPSGFHMDEAFAGYNAYSILTTGESVNRVFLPRYINLFGDFRPAGIVYLIIPFVKFIGLTELAVRLPVAIVGSISPFLIFLFVRKLTKNFLAGYLSALFLTISPWHIVLSRGTAEQVLGIFFAILLSYIVLFIVEKRNFFWFVAAYLALFFSFWTYTAINLFMLMYLPVVAIFIWYRTLSKKMVICWVLMAILYLIFPVLHGVIFESATGRAKQIVDFGGPNGFSNGKDYVFKVLSQENIQMPVLLTRTWHNSLFYGLESVSQRYFNYLSPNFLFFLEFSPERYKVPDIKLLYPLMGIAILQSLYYFVRSPKLSDHRKNLGLVIGMLLVSPVSAAITTDDSPNMSRASIMVVPLVILSGYGLSMFVKARINKNIQTVVFVLFGLFTVWHVLYFWHQYSVHQQYDQGISRNYHSDKTAIYLEKIPKKYTVLAATPVIDSKVFTLFYEKVDPEVAKKTFDQTGNSRISLLNYTLTNENPCASVLEPGASRTHDVYVDSYWCDEPDWAKVVKIQLPDGTTKVKLQYDKSLNLQF